MINNLLARAARYARMAYEGRIGEDDRKQAERDEEALAAMSEGLASLPIETLSLKPDDIIVLSHPGKLSAGQRQELRAAWESLWVGKRYQTVVLEEGMKMAVMRREEAGEQGGGAGA